VSKNLSQSYFIPLHTARTWLYRAAVLILASALALHGTAQEARAIKSKVAPIYPEIAKRMKISGVVKVEATVDADGKVTSVKTLSGNLMLSPAAEAAIRKWRFQAASAESKVNIDLNFSLVQ
jgi:TonB family protein